MGWAAGALVLVLAALLLFGPTGRDDVYKTLWPAKMFAQTGSILNYNGNALEQSSSLLHVLLLGGLHRVTGLDLPDLNVAFVLVAGLGCVGMVVRLGRKAGVRDLVALGFVSGGQSLFAYWAMGGLDAVLTAVCLLFWVDAADEYWTRRRWWPLAIAALLVALVRPEGAIVALVGLGVAAAVGLLWCKKVEPVEGDPSATRLSLRNLVVPAVLLITVAILLGAWRIWHGGHWMPQTVIAKAGGVGMGRLLDGLRYLKKETFAHPDLAMLWVGAIWSIVGLVRRRRAETIWISASGLVVAGMAFVVVTGGDWMENGRFLVPFLPLWVLVVFVDLERWMAGRWRWLSKGLWMAVTAFGLYLSASHFSTGYPLIGGGAPATWLASQSKDASISSLPLSERFNRVHLRDVVPLKALKEATASVYARKHSPVTVLSQQAGMMAYHLCDAYYGKVRFIDLVGLCTADFTDCPVTAGRGNFPGGLNMDLVYFFEDLPRLGRNVASRPPTSSLVWTRQTVPFAVNWKNMAIKWSLSKTESFRPLQVCFQAWKSKPVSLWL